MNKPLAKIFKKYRNDSTISLLESSYQRVASMETQAKDLSIDYPNRSLALNNAEKIKLRITTAAISRSNIIEKNHSNRWLISSCTLLSVFAALFALYQNQDISRKNALAKNELLQVVGEGLEQLYQESFSRFQDDLVKQMGVSFQDLNKTIQEHVTKELDEEHAFFKNVYNKSKLEEHPKQKIN